MLEFSTQLCERVLKKTIFRAKYNPLHKVKSTKISAKTVKQDALLFYILYNNKVGRVTQYRV
jgi:hypothetical protein